MDSQQRFSVLCLDCFGFVFYVCLYVFMFIYIYVLVSLYVSECSLPQAVANECLLVRTQHLTLAISNVGLQT